MAWKQLGVAIVSLAVLAAPTSARPSGKLETYAIWLKDQPGYRVSNLIRAKFDPQFDQLQQQLLVMHRLRFPSAPMRPEDEQRITARGTDWIRDLQRPILAEVDQLRTAMISEIAAAADCLAKPSQARVIAAIQKLGGTVTSTMPIPNIVIAELPPEKVEALKELEQVGRVQEDAEEHPELDLQQTSLGVNSGFWTAGVDGGVFDAGVCDTGVQQNHPNLIAHPFESNMGAADSNGHGTSVAGIMASDHPTIRGLAYGLHTIAVAQASPDTTTMTSFNYLMTGTVERPENVNFSFSAGTATTDYGPIDQFFDAVIDAYGIMVSKSTGNGGYSVNPTITRPAPAYNLLASANMDDLNTVGRADDVITSSSSRGPTTSGRKKPDITAPGTNTNTTTRTLGFTTTFGGTSSASPHTGAGILLLMDLGLTEPLACKAVLLNTADAWRDNNTQTTADDGPTTGTHWNRTFGWGYLDLGEAYTNGLDAFIRTLTAPGGGQSFRLFKGTMFTNEKATLCYNRHVTYIGAAYPTNIEGFSNLDLFAYRLGTGALLTSSTSAIDSVEQLAVASDGEVVLKVASLGSFDPQVTTERFALATEEGFSEAIGPKFDARRMINSPKNPLLVNVVVTQTGDLPNFGGTITLNGAAVVGNASQALPSLAPGQSATLTWTLANNRYEKGGLTASVSAPAYGETFSSVIPVR